MLEIILAWTPQLLKGALATIGFSIVSFFLGLIIGILSNIFYFSKNSFLKLISNFYTVIIRSLPELMVIYLIFYGGASFSNFLFHLFNIKSSLVSNIFIAIFALSLISGTYSAEVIRAAYLSIPKGQIEGAIALGMPKKIIFLRILIPQTIAYGINNFNNIFLLAVKDTSLLSIIGIKELLSITNFAVNSTQSPFLLYFYAGLIYLILTYIFNIFFHKLALKSPFINNR
jgi:His/Glu/Gln/Arg/opine family amino acid ABC transporter permease subunit